jgi:hypothetical protein
VSCKASSDEELPAAPPPQNGNRSGIDRQAILFA